MAPGSATQGRHTKSVLWQLKVKGYPSATKWI